VFHNIPKEREKQRTEFKDEAIGDKTEKIMSSSTWKIVNEREDRREKEEREGIRERKRVHVDMTLFLFSELLCSRKLVCFQHFFNKRLQRITNLTPYKQGCGH
jgi:hypothetical protein